MTDLRVTLASAEAWVSSNTVTRAQVLQLSAQAWVSSLGPPLFGTILAAASARLTAPATAAPLAGQTTGAARGRADFNVVSSNVALNGRILAGMTQGRALLSVVDLTPQPDFDWQATVISQYANSPILLQLLANFFDYIDQTVNLDSFYRLVWNVDLAVGYGLDVWGRIVGVSRILELSVSGPFFGFKEATDAEGFNVAPFWSGTGSSSSFSLSDEAYRQLILAKALANITDGSIPSINQLLINLFGSGPLLGGNAYVQDNNDMTMVYVFEFHPTPVQLAIIEQSGVIPKPTGVSVTVSVPP